MSDTIIGAAIALVSGAVCAWLTGFMNQKAAKASADSERKRRLREEKKLVFSQFISSCHAFLHQATLNTDPGLPLFDAKAELDLFAQFQTAYSTEILICDKSSIDILTELFNQVSKLLISRDYSQLTSAFKSAIDAMRKELDVLEN